MLLLKYTSRLTTPSKSVKQGSATRSKQTTIPPTSSQTKHVSCYLRASMRPSLVHRHHHDRHHHRGLRRGHHHGRSHLHQGGLVISAPRIRAARCQPAPSARWLPLSRRTTADDQKNPTRPSLASLNALRSRAPQHLRSASSHAHPSESGRRRRSCPERPLLAPLSCFQTASRNQPPAPSLHLPLQQQMTPAQAPNDSPHAGWPVWPLAASLGSMPRSQRRLGNCITSCRVVCSVRERVCTKPAPWNCLLD